MKQLPFARTEEVPEPPAPMTQEQHDAILAKARAKDPAFARMLNGNREIEGRTA